MGSTRRKARRRKSSGALNKAVNDALADPEMKKIADLGGMMLGGIASEFGKFLVAETDKWAKVIHDADLKLME